jgi:RNA polymerase sigma-70 factor, ECF subfamily
MLPAAGRIFRPAATCQAATSGEAGLTDHPVRSRAAQQELFAAEYPRLAGWARRLVDDNETAHEIAAEAFTRLMSRWSAAENPHAYLYKIASNLVRDHWRRRSRDRTVHRAMATEHLRQLDPRSDGSANLRAMLEDLPEHQRTAVLLHYLAGFSIHDVSQVVGRPEGTVKSDLSQARMRLRHSWESSHD